MVYSDINLLYDVYAINRSGDFIKCVIYDTYKIGCGYINNPTAICCFKNDRLYWLIDCAYEDAGQVCCNMRISHFVSSCKRTDKWL